MTLKASLILQACIYAAITLAWRHLIGVPDLTVCAGLAIVTMVAGALALYGALQAFRGRDVEYRDREIYVPYDAEPAPRRADSAPADDIIDAEIIETEPAPAYRVMRPRAVGR